MPRYYFDLHDGEDFAEDGTGFECASLEEVGELAVGLLPDMAKDELPDGPQRHFWVKVRDEEGKYVFEASLILTTTWLTSSAGNFEKPDQRG